MSTRTLVARILIALGAVVGVAGFSSAVDAAGCYCVGEQNLCITENNQCTESPYERCFSQTAGGEPVTKAEDCADFKKNGLKQTYQASGSPVTVEARFDTCTYSVSNDCSEARKSADDAAIAGEADADAEKEKEFEDEQEEARANQAQQLQIRKPVLNILIPNLTFSDIRTSTIDDEGYVQIPWIGEYVAALYSLAVSIASILAVILVIREGVRIIMSGGGDGKIEGYRNIGRIVAGVILAWSSYVILYNVNANLVSFKPLQVRYAEGGPIVVDAAAEDAVDSVGGRNYTGSVFVPPGNGESNVPYYAQWEGPWAKKKPGDPEWPLSQAQQGRTDCTTIQQRGCGPTSLAMVMNYYGEKVTPLDTGRWGLGCTGAWQPWDTYKTFSDKWPSLKMEILKVRKSDKVAIRQKVLQYLSQGKPLVYNCAPCAGLNRENNPGRTYRGHYMVLTHIITQGDVLGMDPSQVYVGVNDPGANEKNRIRKMSLKNIIDNYVIAVYVDKR